MEYNFTNSLVLRYAIGETKDIFSDKDLKLNKDSSSLFEKAVISASADLGSELMNIEKQRKGKNNLELSMLKYRLRYHNRATPFGLFSGCSELTWGSNTEVKVEKHKIKTHLDEKIIRIFKSIIEGNDKLRSKLKWFQNPTTYEYENKVRFYKNHIINNIVKYELCEIENSDELQKILERAIKGIKTGDMVEILINDGHSKLDSLDFSQQIIDSGILISELAPTALIESNFDVIRNFIQEYKKDIDDDLIETVNKLSSAIKLLANIDSTALNFLNNLEKTRKILDNFNIPAKKNELINFSINSAVTGQIDASIKSKLKNVVQLLVNMDMVHYSNHNIVQFKSTFERLFGEKKINILQLFDEFKGVNYPNSNINKETHNIIRDVNRVNNNNQININIHPVLLKKLRDSRINSDYIIKISESDFEKKKTKLPESFRLAFSVLNNNNKLQFFNASGPGALNLIGRFSFIDKGIKKIYSDISKFENEYNKQKIIAEIDHIPHLKLANVLKRPNKREFSIPIFSGINVNSIYLRDIFVSLQNNKFILTHKPTGKIILPKLSNAHSYSIGNFPIYSFLCDLQTEEDVAGAVYFNWGEVKEFFHFLPRIEYKNVVLSPATWNLKEEDCKFILSNKCEVWMKYFQFPKKILINERDNKLLINLNDDLNLKLFYDILKKNKSMLITESLIEDSFSKISNIDSSLSHELIAFLTKASVQEEKSIPELNETEDKWIYFKLYLNPKVSDYVLQTNVLPLFEYLKKENKVDRFFYMRYKDPDFHLRIRFRIKSHKEIGQINSDIKEYFSIKKNNSNLHRIEFDKYIPERKRYLNKYLSLAEEIFYIDSLNVLKLKTLINDYNEESTWLYAIYYINYILDEFDITSAEKLILFKHLRDSYYNMFSGDKLKKKEIDKRFRFFQEKIQNILFNDLETNKELKIIRSSLISIKNVNLIIDFSNEDISTRLDFLSSILHMTINRYFIEDPNSYELVLYDFMWKTLKIQTFKK